MGYDLVSVGETMVSFLPQASLPLQYVSGFQKSCGGAESNVCIGLSKLGKKTCWISRLGNDEFGSYIYKYIRGEGVDVAVDFVSSHPTGILFKQFSAQHDNKVFYYRKGSAASTLQIGHIPLDTLKETKVLHLTGILPALSNDCLHTTLELIQFANEHQIPVSFDPNIRLKLWTKEQAKEILLPLLDKISILLLGEDEADLLFGNHDKTTLQNLMKKNQYSMLALKKGADGSVVYTADSIEEIPPFRVQSVDNIGAGDAFDAGFLYGYLEQLPARECGVLGNAMGAFAVMGPGETETLPSFSTLKNFIENREEVLR